MNGQRIADVWRARTPYRGVLRGRNGSMSSSPRALSRATSSDGFAAPGGRIVGVRGRAEDLVNRGRLGPKGLYGWQGEPWHRNDVLVLTAAACKRRGVRR